MAEDTATTAAGATGSADEVVLDVRPILEAGGEPFGKIMETVATLGGRPLHLIANFRPAPLFDVLGQQGYTHEDTEVSPTEWHIRFTKQA